MVEFDIENIIASTKVEKELELEKVAEVLEGSEYNPNSFPGVIYRFKRPRAVALIFDDGKLMCTSARSVEDVEIVFTELIKMLDEKGLL
jgi:transcription initiation factor TFIID TATA-box-binding protein